MLCGVSLQAQTGPLLGAAWYPEQWPEARWDRDLQLMEQAHLHVVRVGEFAWSRMERAEGRYDLDWLERAVRMAEKHHIAVVIGTPTDAPPAWLTRAHPETLRVDATGHRAEHGQRRQFNYANPLYRVYCARIATQLARRFGRDPAVIGWQIGNEYSDESFNAETRRQFQAWLKHRFGTLDALNAAWTTAYWSQTYDSWDEIPLPTGGGNPGLLLEHRHFVSDTWRDFQHVQLGAIRKFAEKRQFITTNLGGLGWSDNFDHYEINKELDLAAWDDYVGQGHLNVARNGALHDFVRGWKRANFWVMETQPGTVNWAPVNNALDRGETRAMAWQAIGHGADDVNYWQWRSALNGQEEIHGVLVGPDGTPVPFYDEASQTAHEFAKVEDSFRGTQPVSQVALLYSYDSHWAIQFQKHTEKYDDIALLKSYYRALRQISQSVDVVSGYAPLGAYKLVAAPDLNVLPKDLADHLLEYVRNGGNLVLGPRSGMKDEFNALLPQRQPGFLVDALGARVAQYYALEKDVPLSGTWGTGEASIWAEQLESNTPGGEVLLRYGKSNGWLDDKPAVITRVYGKGRITYIGAILDDKLMASAAAWLTQKSGVTPIFGPVPDGVEVSRRLGLGKQVFVIINYSAENREVALPHTMKLLLDGKDGNVVQLPRYGVAVALDK